jgi:predicted ATPase
VRQLLKEPADVLDTWRRRIREAVGGTGRALVELVPSLTLLIGEQPELPPLPPQQSENRMTT